MLRDSNRFYNSSGANLIEDHVKYSSSCLSRSPTKMQINAEATTKRWFSDTKRSPASSSTSSNSHQTKMPKKALKQKIRSPNKKEQTQKDSHNKNQARFSFHKTQMTCSRTSPYTWTKISSLYDWLFLLFSKLSNYHIICKL